MRSVCQLSPDEYSAWSDKGIVPDRHDHRHIKVSDAWEQTLSGRDHSPYATPIAKWVGPHHIVPLTQWSWRPRPSGRISEMAGSPSLCVLQLVEGG